MVRATSKKQRDALPAPGPALARAGTSVRAMPAPRSKGTSKTSAKYVGVLSVRGRYRAQICTSKLNINVGRWDTAEEAAIACDRVVLHTGLDRPLNLPERSCALGPAVETLRREVREAFKEITKSQYRGLTFPRKQQGRERRHAGGEGESAGRSPPDRH